MEVTQPVIALCMGEAGKLSRVLNTYLTPVTHPALHIKVCLLSVHSPTAYLFVLHLLFLCLCGPDGA